MRLFVIILSLLAVVSCGRKSGNTSRVGSAKGTANGSAVLGGKVAIMNECGTGPARIYLGDTNRYYVNDQTVPNGGSFSFQVNPGSYHMYAVAGGCSVSTDTPIQSGYTDYKVCLGNVVNCQSATYNKMTFKMGDDAIRPAASGLTAFCDWKDWGCAALEYPGKGEALFESKMRVTAKKTTNFSLELDYQAGNDWVFTTPGLEEKGWNLTAQVDGHFQVGDVTYESLFVKSQIARSSLQFSAGFCAKGSELPGQLSEYAKAHGFSDLAADDLQTRAEILLKSQNRNFCVYPQSSTEVDHSVLAKSSVSTQLRRLWFALAPQITTAEMKKSPIPGLQVGVPKTNLLKQARDMASTTRKVASTEDVLIEDLGLGFLIQH